MNKMICIFHRVLSSLLLVVLFFSIFVGPASAELPTAQIALIKDINPGSPSSNIWTMMSASGQVFFNADDGVHGNELWVSDGTADGTHMVKDLNPSGGVMLLATDGKRLYFAMNDEDFAADKGYLYVTDGSSAGTILLHTFLHMNNNEDWLLSLVQNGKFYLAWRNNGIELTETSSELWVSSGTPESTKLLLATAPSIYINFLLAGSSQIFFQTVKMESWNSDQKNNALNISIWHTDGTAAGTVPLKSNFCGRWKNAPGVLNDTIYFSAASKCSSDTYFSEAQELWAANGISHTTTKLLTFPYVRGSNALVNDTVRNFALLNGKLIFYFMHIEATYSSCLYNESIWITNGTASGTTKVKEYTYPSGNGDDISILSKPFVAGSLLYYTVLPAAPLTGWSLMRTDGTTANTFQVHISAAPPAQTFPQRPEIRSRLGNTPESILFTSDGPYLTPVLYHTDGSVSGTLAISTLPVDLSWDSQKNYIANTFYIMKSMEDDTGFIFRSDGTEVGTEMITQLGAGYNFRGIGSRVNDTLLLVVDDTNAAGGDHGAELWGLKYDLPNKLFIPLISK
jgi:ELWxxDGT repeat protein